MSGWRARGALPVTKLIGQLSIRLRWTKCRTRTDEKSLTVVTVDGATGRRLHDGWNFIQSPYFVRRRSLRSLSTDGRRRVSLPTAVGVATAADLHLLLRWTRTRTDRARGRGEGIQTPSSEPPSWTLPLSSVSATRPWQCGCSAPWKKVTKRKSPNRSVFLLLPPPSIPTHSRPPATTEANNPRAYQHRYHSFRRASPGTSCTIPFVASP